VAHTQSALKRVFLTRLAKRELTLARRLCQPLPRLAIAIAFGQVSLP